MKNIENFTQWKNESVDVMFIPAIMHQKLLEQSGGSSRSAVVIFNSLCVFTTEPIREQEIKLECMNINVSANFTKNQKNIILNITIELILS